MGGEDFKEAFSFCHTQLQLKDVLEQCSSFHGGKSRTANGGFPPDAESRTVKGPRPGVKKNRSTGCRVRKFTQDEDEVIREVMAKVEKVGTADIKALASRLDRG